MKTLALIFCLVPAIFFSQIKKTAPLVRNDSLVSKFYNEKDSAGVISIPNKTFNNETFYGLISKSKGNAVAIPNGIKRKDTALVRKTTSQDAIPPTKIVP
ncbi:hypothetical protein [Chryseobacterium taklimakanense]|nr:hypothetical protein [Chryseobacterium taklimakanense]